MIHQAISNFRCRVRDLHLTVLISLIFVFLVASCTNSSLPSPVFKPDHSSFIGEWIMPPVMIEHLHSKGRFDLPPHQLILDTDLNFKMGNIPFDSSAFFFPSSELTTGAGTWMISKTSNGEWAVVLDFDTLISGPSPNPTEYLRIENRQPPFWLYKWMGDWDRLVLEQK